MNFCLASLATKVLREKSCKVKSCVLRDARLVPTILLSTPHYYLCVSVYYYGSIPVMTTMTSTKTSPVHYLKDNRIM